LRFKNFFIHCIYSKKEIPEISMVAILSDLGHGSFLV